MRLRFVTCNDPVSTAIRAREGQMARWVGFTPSHVELVVKEGYLGAHYDGGVQIRPVGYDASTLARELFVDVVVASEKTAEAFARGKIGTAYDWHAIVDYLLPTDFHEPGDFICSALVTGTLDKGGAFAHPLALPWHLVSPSLLLFWISGRTAIPSAPAAEG